MAVLSHQCMGFVTELQMNQLAVFIEPTTQQCRIKAAALSAAHHEHLAAHQWFFADLHVRDHLVARQHSLDQQLQFAACGLLAKDAGLDHLGVVEDQQVARVEQAGQFAEDAVDHAGDEPSSKREPLRSAAGCWAISSGGCSKSKSLSVKERGRDADMIQGLTGPCE